MKRDDPSFALCSVRVFARWCALPVERVQAWVEAGVLPSKQFGGVPMIDLQRLSCELLEADLK